MNIHPAYLEPRVIGYRPGKLPDVFIVQCFGYNGSNPLDMEGRTKMGCERRTVYRYVCEADEDLLARVDVVAKAFKAKYGWNQSVSVIYDYEASAAHGQLWRTWDDLINLRAYYRHFKGTLKRAKEREDVDHVIRAIEAHMVLKGVGCVPPGLH